MLIPLPRPPISSSSHIDVDHNLVICGGLLYALEGFILHKAYLGISCQMTCIRLLTYALVPCKTHNPIVATLISTWNFGRWIGSVILTQLEVLFRSILLSSLRT